MTLIKTTRFGDIEVDESQLYCFEQGLPGFPDEKKFVLLPYEPESPFFFLQAQKNPDLAFLLVEPFSFFKDYQFELSDDLAEEMDLSEENRPLIFNIVTVPEKQEEMTANLLAPLILSPRKQRGLQWVLEKSQYEIKHRLFPSGINKPESVKGAK